MYIRIQNNSIRFRVSEQEARSLIDCVELKDSFRVPNQQQLDYSISTAENDSFDFKTSNHLKLQVSLDKLKSELSTRPSKKGIQLDQSFTQGVEVFLEIDIKRKK
ncbi:MAG: hypothetical protein COB38_07045 [Gammaproteobacteria bacterium]|nr:MAG: hypothetical protein COB38_07045 [Gammaproteobacteria bacterium]